MLQQCATIYANCKVGVQASWMILYRIPQCGEPEIQNTIQDTVDTPFRSTAINQILCKSSKLQLRLHTT